MIVHTFLDNSSKTSSIYIFIGEFVGIELDSDFLPVDGGIWTNLLVTVNLRSK